MPSDESDKYTHHLKAGVKATLRAISRWTEGTSRAEGEEAQRPAFRRPEELTPVVPPSLSPQLGLQTTQGLAGCAIAAITTGTDITELVIHHV